MKVETYLPVFSGFYGTIWEPNEDSEIEYINEERERKGLEPVDFDAIDFDYSGYREHAAKQITYAVEDHLKDFVKSIKFQELRSPREYNFANDSINVEITLTQKNVKVIRDFLKTNKEAFANYLRDTYTSRSGFISFYPNYIEGFCGDLKEALQDKHKLGSILNFIAFFEDGNETELNLYYRCNDLNLQATNYSELIGEDTENV